MAYEPCIFEREEYLQHAEAFESLKIDDVENELTEHNYDITDIAYELAYSRYRLAKLEKILRLVHKQSLVVQFIAKDGLGLKQESLGDEFAEVLYKNLWDLYS